MLDGGVKAGVCALDEHVQADERLLVVDFFESVQLLVVGLAVGVDLGAVVCSELAFERPFAVDEAQVAEIEMVLVAERTAELGQLLLKLEDAVASVDHEEVLVCLALAVLAVTKPVEAVVDLPVPRLTFLLPVDLLNVAQEVEPEVDADGQQRTLFLGRVEFHNCVHRQRLQVAVRTTVLHELAVDLVGALQARTVHALVAVVVLVFVLHVEQLVQCFKQVLVVLELFLLYGEDYFSAMFATLFFGQLLQDLLPQLEDGYGPVHHQVQVDRLALVRYYVHLEIGLTF